MARDNRDGNIEWGLAGKVLNARCELCGYESTALIDREICSDRDLFARRVSRWLADLVRQHEHKPTRCPGEPGEHFFPGHFGRDEDKNKRCACGLTEDEACEQISNHYRTIREHAEMGWP